MSFATFVFPLVISVGAFSSSPVRALIILIGLTTVDDGNESKQRCFLIVVQKASFFFLQYAAHAASPALVKDAAARTSGQDVF